MKNLKAKRMKYDTDSLFKSFSLKVFSFKKNSSFIHLVFASFTYLFLSTGCSKSIIDIEMINKKSIVNGSFFGGQIPYSSSTMYSWQNGHELYLLNKTTNQMEKIQDFDPSLNLRIIGGEGEGFPFYLKDQNTGDLYRLDANFSLHLLGASGWSNLLVEENFLIVYHSASISSFADHSSNGLEPIASAFQVDPVLYNGLSAYVGKALLWGKHTGTASNKLLLFDGKSRTFREIPNTQNELDISEIFSDEENFAVFNTSPNNMRFFLNLKNGNLIEIVGDNSERWVSSFTSGPYSYVVKQSSVDNTEFKLYEMNTLNGNLTYLNSFPASVTLDHGESCFFDLGVSNQRIYNQTTHDLVLLCTPKGDKGEIYIYNTLTKAMTYFTPANGTFWENNSGSWTTESLFYFNGSLYLSGIYFNANGDSETKKINLSNNQIIFEDMTEAFGFIESKICETLQQTGECNASIISVGSIGNENDISGFFMITATIGQDAYVIPVGMVMNNHFYMSTPIRADTDPSLLMSLMMTEQFKLMSNIYPTGAVLFGM